MGIKKIFCLFVYVCIFKASLLIGAEVSVEQRHEDWFLDKVNPSDNGVPSDLKYFKFYDVMPDEITLEIFKNKNLSEIQDKKLYVGYGISDPTGKNCAIFKAETTSNGVEIKVCLPWWRKEIEYLKDKTVLSSISSVLDNLTKPKPPLMVNVCSKWSTPKKYPGGKATCTTYYDKIAGGGCWSNPVQPRCFVDNCGSDITNNCTYIDSVSGEEEELKSSIDDAQGVPMEADTKFNLTTHQYTCPSGPIEKPSCEEQKSVLMFPYECTPDDPEDVGDNGEYVYCDESKPIYDGEGVITGFNGKCGDGRAITCKVNSFSNSTNVCIEPIYETNSESKVYETKLTRTYKNREVDVLSGEPDMYSGDESCLRANTVEDARNQELRVKIIGSGSLDDDVYVLRHKSDGGHTKIYCNMQHAESRGSRKSYNGGVLQCIDNNGSYSFNKTVPIEVTDIVTVQQNSENENASGAPFAIGRNHYSSTSLSIEGVQVAPRTFSSNFPYYPKHGSHLKTWDNTTATFSILFPFAGAYEIFFYNKNGDEIAISRLNIEDFKSIQENGSMQLKLGKIMKLAPGMQDDEFNENGSLVRLRANREDDFVEWGGGVYGGRHSKNGASSNSPNDSYVKKNAATKIIVKDLLTGSITPINLVYPLPYPNRIYVSKLKVYEHRKYRCYNEFASFAPPSTNVEEKFVCSSSPIWKDFKNDLRQDISGLQKWDNTQLCEQNCRNYNECVPKKIGEDNGFTCTDRAGADIGGDLQSNLFSNKTSCDSVCYAQSNCASYMENDCELIDEQLSRPVSDLTGKTLYKQKDVAFVCTKETQKQVGCAKYDVKYNEGELTYNFEAIGWETKDFSGQFEDTLTDANIIDVGSQHIWSGWQGKCVKGMKMDSSYLSDPMTIASYAMSAYQSYSQLSGGSSLTSSQAYKDYVETPLNDLKETFKGPIEAYENASAAVRETYDNAVKAFNDSELGQAISSGAEKVEELDKAFDDTAFGEAYKDVKGWWNDTILKPDVPLFDPITKGDLISFGAEVAFELLAPNEEQFELADKLLNPYANEADPAVQGYNSCMSSIGLSFPSLMSYSTSEPEFGSEQIVDPWKHPLRLTQDQILAISTTMGEKYVQDNYMYSQTDNILLNVVAINSHAYIKAGQVTCAGYKVSHAMDYINQKKGKPLPTMGGGGGTAASIALSALSMINPAIGFAARIIYDAYTNMFVKIDSCKNEEDALARGMIEFKTLKFNKQEQCVQIDSYCDKKFNFGLGSKCVRTGYDFCCYDKITTRIYAEGLKQQLNQGWDNCVGITVDDLKDISFRECKKGEVPHINKCFATDKYSEYQQVLFRQGAKGIDVEGLTEQVINSMSVQ